MRGLLAAAAAMGVAELAAGVLGRTSASPLLAVGASFIDLTPVWLKDFAIRRFGDDDKTVLLIGLGVAITVAALAVGLLSRRRLGWGLVGLAAFGVIGVVAALTRPVAEPVDAVPSALGALAGMAALVLLARRPQPSPMTGPGTAAPAGGEATEVAVLNEKNGSEQRPEGGAGPDRRRMLATGAGVVGVAAVGGVLGRILLRRGDVSSVRADLRLPRPASPPRRVPDGAQVRVPGMTPFRTSSKDFYRVDTALVLPQVDPRDWTLRIHGMVARPVEMSFDDLLRRALIERDITLTCVSNQVGGDLAGNARWLGVPLAPLLRGAVELFGRALSDDRVRDVLRTALEASPADVSLTATVYSSPGEFRAGGGDVELDVLVRTRPPSSGPTGPLALAAVEYERVLPAVKHVGEVAKTLFMRRAVRAGLDDAAFVDRQGRFSEATIWNLAFWDGDAVVWPDAEMLVGTTMGIVRRQLDRLGVQQRVQEITATDLPGLAGAVVMNSWTPGVAVNRIGSVGLPEAQGFLELLHQAFQAEPLTEC